MGPKKIKVGEDKEALQRELNHMVATLQNLQLTRQVSGAVWWTVMIPSELGEQALAVTKKFAEDTRGKSNHGMGSPHIQLFRTFIMTLVAAGKKDESLAAEITALEEYLKEFEKAGPKEGHRFIAQARIKNLKDPKFLMLSYALSELLDPAVKHRIDTAIHTSTKKLGAEVKSGTSPPTEAEKELQKSVDSMREKLGIKKK